MKRWKERDVNSFQRAKICSSENGQWYPRAQTGEGRCAWTSQLQTNTNPHTHTEWVWRCCSISSLQSSGLRPLQGYLSLTVEALPAGRQVQRQVCDRVAVMKVLRPAERCISCFLHKIRMVSWPLTSWKFQEVLRSALSWAERPQHRCRDVLWAVSGPLVFILITLTFVPFTSVS